MKSRSCTPAVVLTVRPVVQEIGVAGVGLSNIVVVDSAQIPQSPSSPNLLLNMIIALLAGDVLLPIPSSVISVFAGSAFGLAWGAAVIWAGLMAGCLLGYALGAVPGRGLANRVVGRRDVAGMGRLFEGAGPVVLVLARAVPVLAEASVLAAGAARMPLATFLLTTGLSNIGVALAYAGVGATAAATGSFLLAFIGMCSVPALGWLAWSRLKRRNNNTSHKGNEAE